jgi:thioredoxin-related protein
VRFPEGEVSSNPKKKKFRGLLQFSHVTATPSVILVEWDESGNWFIGISGYIGRATNMNYADLNAMRFWLFIA